MHSALIPPRPQSQAAHLARLRQAGVALPVMLIMLTVMLVSSIYLLKSSTTTTLTTANLAYDSSLSKAVDLGVHTAYAWMRTLPSKAVLINDIPAQGYVATLPGNQTSSSPAFWIGAVVLPPDAAGNQVQYVIHRMCDFPGLYNNPGPPAQTCMLTAAKSNVAAPTGIGVTLAQDAPVINGQPQLHYVITARISGPRGGNVVSESVVMMGP